MSFNPTIPLVSDLMAVSQPQVKANFTAIYNTFNENHTPFNQNNVGMHDLVNFREQSGDPTTLATQIALYTKNVGGFPELFFRPNNSQAPIQLTYPTITTTGAQQQSFVAGPFVVYMGFLSMTSGIAVTLTPASTLIYVGLTLNATRTSLGNILYAAPTGMVANSFTPVFQGGAQTIYYFAIGQ